MKTCFSKLAAVMYKNLRIRWSNYDFLTDVYQVDTAQANSPRLPKSFNQNQVYYWFEQKLNWLLH